MIQSHAYSKTPLCVKLRGARKEILFIMATKKKAVKKEETKKTISAAKKSSVSEIKNPKNMEELLNSSGYSITVPKRGETIVGLVTSVTRKMVLVDIGAKTEGIVADREYDAARDFIQTLSSGDEIDVFIVNEETDKGQILLSLKRAMFDKLWNMLKDYMDNSQDVQVVGIETNRGGMIVRWQGLRGFVPTSQFGSQWTGDIDQLIDKKFKVRPIEVDREKNRLIFSEKHVSEAELLERREQALDKVKVDDTYNGVVTGLMSFGAFVGVEVPVDKKGDDVGKVEGLVHISEISWEKVDKIEEYVKIGNKVQVKVLGVEEGTGKLNLSIKQLKDDPWSAMEKYKEGSKVKGVVSRVAPFGVFVHFEPGVDGLIHISKLPAGEQIKVGDKVDVFVENLDTEQRRMSLNMVLTEVPVGYK